MNDIPTDADKQAAIEPWEAWAREKIMQSPAKDRPLVAYEIGFETARKHYMHDIRRLKEALKQAARWLRRAMTVTDDNAEQYQQFKQAYQRAANAAKKEIKGNAN